MGEAIASSNIEGLLNVFSVKTFVMLVIFQSVIDKLHERVDYFWRDEVSVFHVVFAENFPDVLFEIVEIIGEASTQNFFEVLQ